MSITQIIKDIKGHIHEFFFALLVIIPSFNYYVNSILQLQLGMQSVSPIVYVMLALIGLSSYIHLFSLQNRGVKILVFLLLMAAMISSMVSSISSTLVGKLSNPLESPLLMLLLYCIPALIQGAAVVDWNKVKQYLLPLCVVIILMLLPSYNAVLMNVGILEYMTISYNALLASCFCFCFGMQDKKLWMTVLGALGFLFIITIGARGAAVSSVIFLAIFLTRFLRINDSKNRRSLIYILLISIVGLAYIVPQISEMIMSGNVHSRVFSLMEEGDLFTSNSRQQIRQSMIDGINANPFGYGLWGDKIILSKTYGTQEVVYSHNMLLDFLAYFGIILGPIFLFLILKKIYKMIMPFRQSIQSDLLLVILPYGFIMLLFSGSISDHIVFFALLGLLMNTNPEIDTYIE